MGDAEIGTTQQLVGLLREFEERLPLPVDFASLRVDWVLKVCCVLPL